MGGAKTTPVKRVLIVYGVLPLVVTDEMQRWLVFEALQLQSNSNSKNNSSVDIGRQ
jgi:hypothetical protein